MSNLTVYDARGYGLRMGASSGSFFYKSTAKITYIGMIDPSTYAYKVIDGLNISYMQLTAHSNFDGSITVDAFGIIDPNANFEMYWSDMNFVNFVPDGYVGYVSYTLLNGDDSITGNKYADVIFAGSGNDTVRGYGGNDSVPRQHPWHRFEVVI